MGRDGWFRGVTALPARSQISPRARAGSLTGFQSSGRPDLMWKGVLGSVWIDCGWGWGLGGYGLVSPSPLTSRRVIPRSSMPPMLGSPVILARLMRHPVFALWRHLWIFRVGWGDDTSMGGYGGGGMGWEGMDRGVDG